MTHPVSRLPSQPLRGPQVALTDDLTGAVLFASTLAAAGLSATIDESGPSVYSDLLILNTRSRDVTTAAEASLRVASAMQRVAHDPEHVAWSKRIDSSLRGWVKSELATMLKVIAPRGGLLAPAHPECGRITRGGIHYVDGVPLGDLRALLEDLPGIDRILQGPDFTPGPGSWWLPDISSVEEASRVASIIPWEPGFLVVESSRITSARLAERLPTVLIVQGSTSSLVKRQVEALHASALPGVDLLYQPVDGPRDPRLTRLASTASAQLASHSYCGIVVGGGLTAEVLLDHIGTVRLVPLPSPGPLQGIARIVGGEADGLLLVTKGGSIGDASTLTNLVHILRLAARASAEETIQVPSNSWPSAHDGRNRQRG